MHDAVIPARTQSIPGPGPAERYLRWFVELNACMLAVITILPEGKPARQQEASRAQGQFGGE